MLESVSIVRSVEQLSDTATIVLPGTVFNKALNIESQIARGDRVVVELGYDGVLVNEFEGYLESIQTDDSSIKLMCEDPIFLYRVGLENIELPSVSLKSLLNHVNAEVSKYYPDEKAFELACDYDFKYDKFVIANMTGYDVLKKVQEEAKPNIYLKNRTLHVHPQYIQVFGKQFYNFAVNIESSDLKYKQAEDRRLLVTVESKDKKGKVIKAEAGKHGGDKMHLKVAGITEVASLKRMAEEALAQKVYTGYEGSFTSWLIPYCDSGYKVRIRDTDYEFKNGMYYVLEVKVDFSKDGGKRTIKIGKKIG